LLSKKARKALFATDVSPEGMGTTAATVCANSWKAQDLRGLENESIRALRREVAQMKQAHATIIAIGILAILPQRVVAKSPPQTLRIEGVVSTADDTPIANVVVRVWRNGKIDSSVSTDDAGHFVLRLTGGEPVDAVTFAPPDMRFYGPAMVENLSGRHDQQINIALFEHEYFKSILRHAADSSHVDLNPVRRQASLINRLIEIESGLPHSPDSDPSRYREFIHRMRADDALYGRQEAAEVDSYLEAVESKLARASELRGDKPNAYHDTPLPATSEY
jgi:hypothetical protein